MCNPKEKRLVKIPRMIHMLVSRVVEKLANYLAGPDCGEHSVVHMLDEDVGDGVAELASGERVRDDAFLSWSGCESLKNNSRIICRWRK